MKTKSIMIISVLIIFIIISATLIYFLLDANKKDDVEEPENNYFMSYSYAGGWSPYSYAEVNITGTNAIVSLKMINSDDIIAERQLSDEFVNEMIGKYLEMDFFNMEIDDIFVFDVGRTTISFEYNNMNRTITYIRVENENLTNITSMFWKIISQEEYLNYLEDYKNLDNSSLVGKLSGLSADIRNEKILDPDEFIPIFKEMILNEENRDTYGYWALDCLAEIRGEVFDGDFDLALKWIGENY